MNKKNIADIRKQFKTEDSLLKIKEIYNVYVKRETGEIVYSVNQPFGMLELEQQELFMENFKKVLAGTLDAKLFDLKFDSTANGTQEILLEGLNNSTEYWTENMDAIVEKFFTDIEYQQDSVFTFVRAELRAPTGKRSKEEDAGKDDDVFVHRFILGSMNHVEIPKKAVMFDYVEKEFKSNPITDVILNLNKPLEGFMFPTFSQGKANVNRVLYSAGKKNCPNHHFIENVLNCVYVPTAVEEKSKFDLILRSLVGEKTDTETLSSIYEAINKVVEDGGEDGEPAVLDAKDIEGILKSSGVANADKVKDAFKDVLDDTNYEFKAETLIPAYSSKSLKIRSKTANVDISPKDLRSIRQVVDSKGRKCILIEVDETLEIEGFEIETERLTK